MSKYTFLALNEFVNSLPTDMDYGSFTYGKIVIDSLDLHVQLEAWLKRMNPEDSSIGE